jgi:hypothetical protein
MTGQPLGQLFDNAKYRRGRIVLHSNRQRPSIRLSRLAIEVTINKILLQRAIKPLDNEVGDATPSIPVAPTTIAAG